MFDATGGGTIVGGCGREEHDKLTGTVELKPAHAERPARREGRQTVVMCRNIKTLANFAPPATDDEIRASALQFVRKLSGIEPSVTRERGGFQSRGRRSHRGRARLIRSLKTSAPPRNREEEARKAQERSRERFATAT